MEIRPLTKAEQKYTYMQSMQIRGQTGSIGVLQGRYGADKEFGSIFHDLNRRLKTDEFEAGLSEVLYAKGLDRKPEKRKRADKNRQEVFRIGN